MNLCRRNVRIALFSAAVFAAPAALAPVVAAPKPAPKLMTEAEILSSMKGGPKGFDTTVFAMPPNVGYPTAIAATGGGDLYVAIDEDGSLGKEPNRGWVVKCVDTDNDGKADKFVTFAKMDHPRGLFFDSSTDTLYVLHPPFITAFQDTDGDGVADKSEVLATGIANEKIQQQRGADHTTNGFRLGIDGWLYIAQGDFGSVKAVGKDGQEMVRHGGGVTRIRIDGSGVETYSTGQRNICDVAVDPLLNVYTRDNTNDGDGWDVRLSYVVPSGYYGYPSFYKNFQDEMLQPLADLGGGSPVGAYFLAEPNFPAPLPNSFFSVEWGKGAIYRHPLEANGAGFKLVTPQAAGGGKAPREEEFMTLPRGIDMDADAVGHLYVASWINGSFNYSGPNVGYVARVTPKGQKPATFPDLKRAADDQLVQFIASPSAITRQYAQREILKRGIAAPAAFQKGLEALATSKESLPVRVAALFTLKQLHREKSNEFVVSLCKQDDLRELALRALADKREDTTVPVGPFVEALTDPNPRVRLMAAYGLGRLNKAEAAAQLIPLVADADPIVAHVAITALVELKATAVALKAVDPASAKLAPGALRVLQRLHDTQVVDGLTEKLKSVTDPALRTNIYGALARLHFREADWDGSWWGTRPDTSGPYFKTAEWDGTPKIQDALKAALTSEKPEVLRDLVILMQKNKVDFPELTATLNQIAQKDPAFKAVLVELAANRAQLTAEQIALLGSVAAADKEAPAKRAKALRVLQKHIGKPAALDAAVGAAATLVTTPSSDPELSAAFTEFVRDSRFSGMTPYFNKLTLSEETPRRDLAYVVLVNLSTNKLLQKDRRVLALAAELDKAWAKPAHAASLLRAIAITKAEAYKEKVKAALDDLNPEVATAAQSAARELKIAVSGSAPVGVPTAAPIEKLPYEQVLATAVKEKGDAKQGEQFFTKQGCIQCHTVSASEPPKGPFLGGIATRYSRAELVESIVKPSAKISQGFETQWFKDKEDETYEGFVTRDAGDEIELRNILGVTVTLKKSDIKERGKRDTSVMPENLVAKLTPQELASILAYLESLKGK